MVARTKKQIDIDIKTKGEADLKKLTRSFENVKKSVDRSSRSLKTLERNSQRTAKAMGAITGILVGWAANRGFKAIVNATVAQEQAVAQLEAAIKSTGNASGQSAPQLQAFAKEMQAIGVEGDEAVLGVQSMLLTFKEIGAEGDTFNRTTRAVLDLSVAMKQDLKSSAVQLGKALNDPVANLGALGRTGIQFSESQQELIKALAKTGRMAEAQAIILKELESQFGGSAEAARKTLGGALKALQNNFGDLLEVSGPALDDVTGSMNDLADLLADPRTAQAAQSFASAILSIGTAAARAAVNIVDFSNFLGKFIAQSMGFTTLDDLPLKIAAINEELETRQQGFTSQLNRKVGFIGYTTEELEAERAELKRLYEQLKEFGTFEGMDFNTPAAAATGTPSVTGGGAPTTPKDWDKEINWFEVLAERAKEANKEMEAQKAALESLANTYTMAHDPLAAYEAELAKIASVQDQLDPEVVKAAVETAAESYREATEQIGEFEQVFVDGFGKNLDTMLDGVLQGTQDVKDGIKDMVRVMIAELLKLAAYKTVMSMFGGTDIGKAFGASTNATKWASGGVVSGGGVPFVTSQGINVMAEKGPEAIMPLSKDSSGNLGVSAAPVNVTVNNNAGVDVQTSQNADGGLTIDIIRQALASDIQTGGNPLSNALSNSFGLSRGAAAY